MSQWLLKLKRSLAIKNRERYARWGQTRRYRRIRLAVGIILGAIIIALGSLIYPTAELFTPQDWPDAGDVAIEDIVAPVDFPIPKTPEELAEERRMTEARAPLILAYDRRPVDSIMQVVGEFFNRLDSLSATPVSDESLLRRLRRDFPWVDLDRADEQLRNWPILRAYFQDILRGFYVAGVFPDRRYLPFSESNFVLVVRPNREIPLKREQILDVEGARRSLTTDIMDAPLAGEKLKRSLAIFAEQFVVANLEFDPVTTDARKQRAIEQIQPIKIQFFKGERIVRKNQRVTTEHVDRLRALSLFIAAQARDEFPLAATVPIIVRIVLIGMCIFCMAAYLVFFQPKAIQRISHILALGVIWIITVLSAYAIWRAELSEYLIPIAISSILITVLFNLGMGVFSTFCLSILIGVITGFDFTLMFVSIAVGTITAYSVRTVHHRYDFYRPILYGAITYTILIYLLETLRFQPNGDILALCGIGVLNATFSAILCIGLLPVFESLFGFTTDLTLLELSDLNHPLLHRLSMEAPGTYHHSLMIGSLCEAAAEAVGANPLLVRIGAYFHDIGKIQKPEYFVENQTAAKSRHDKLAPTMSALILESHVKIGRELALQYDLPDAIIDFIEQHHGTTVMRFFLHKAQQQMPEGEVPTEEFRYPGPKPQSKEAAILMLADSVEAVSRTLGAPKPNRLRTAIGKVVREKFEAGQLDECELTLKDLNRIEDSFLKRLLGSFHQRVQYPEGEKEKAT